MIFHNKIARILLFSEKYDYAVHTCVQFHKLVPIAIKFVLKVSTSVPASAVSEVFIVLILFVFCCVAVDEDEPARVSKRKVSLVMSALM